MAKPTNDISVVSFIERLKHFFLLLRVPQWINAAFVMLGFCYTPSRGYFSLAVLAALAFCFISSAASIYNDIEDRTKRTTHPPKRYNLLVSGQVTSFEAIFMLFLLLFLGLVLGWALSKKLAMILCAYLVLNIAHTHLFKFFPIIDVLCIASGFMLRILAGTLGIGLSISIWLTVAATLLSLFIALNKYRMDLQLDLKSRTKNVVQKYNSVILHGVIVSIGIATFLTYLFYIIYAQDESFYFMLTLPFAAIALWRFTLLAAQNKGNVDPVIVFFSDQLSRINLWCFVVLTFMALAQ